MSVVERILRRAGGSGGERSLDGGVLIEPMRRRDLKAGVLETEAQSYPTPWTPGVFQSELDQVRRGTRFYLVARRLPAGDADATDVHAVRRRGEIVGHAGLWFAVDEAHVTNVAVRESARRSGIGRRLMLVLADAAVRRGCVAWTLEVRVSSTGAQDLYRRFGFAPAGVRQRYYENSEDAIVMWCHDIQSPAYRRRLDDIASEAGIAR